MESTVVVVVAVAAAAAGTPVIVIVITEVTRCILILCRITLDRRVFPYRTNGARVVRAIITVNDNNFILIFHSNINER